MPGLHLLNHLGQRHLQGRLGANLLWPRRISTNLLDAIYTMILRRTGFVVFMAPPESLGSAISFTEWTMRSGQYCNRCGMSMSDCTQTRNAHLTSPWLTCSDRGCVDPGLLIVVLTFSLSLQSSSSCSQGVESWDFRNLGVVEIGLSGPLDFCVGSLCWRKQWQR